MTIGLLSRHPLTPEHAKPEQKLLQVSAKKKGVTLLGILPQDIHIAFTGTDVIPTYNDTSLLDLDGLIIRGTKGFEDIVYLLTLQYEHLGKPIIDSFTASIGSTGKLMQLYAHSSHHIPYIPSYFCTLLSPDTIESFLNIHGIPKPYVVKQQRGRGGNYVYKCNNLSSYEKAYTELSTQEEKEIIIQPYINIAHEYRVMVVNGTALGVVEKKSNNFVKNVEQGGILVPVEKESVAKLAETVAHINEGILYGIDIAETSDGTLLVIEANRAPKFEAFTTATSISVADHIIDFFIHSKK